MYHAQLPPNTNLQSQTEMQRYTHIYSECSTQTHASHVLMHAPAQTQLHASADTQRAQKRTWGRTCVCSHGYKHTPMTCSRQHHEPMAEPKEINLQGQELSPGLQWQGLPSRPSLLKGGYQCAGSHTRLNTHAMRTATHTDSLTPPCTFQQQYEPALPPLLPSS